MFPWKPSVLLFFCTLYFTLCTKQKAKQYKQKALVQSYKTQIEIPAYPGLALSGFKQPGPGVRPLGLA